MKLLLPVAAILIVCFAGIQPVQPRNPLANTKWDGTGGLTVFFTKSDTIKLSMAGQVVLTAQYKVKDSTLTWRDFVVSDASCDTSIRGNYSYKIKDSILTFRVISDRCEERANIIQTLILNQQ